MINKKISIYLQFLWQSGYSLALGFESQLNRSKIKLGRRTGIQKLPKFIIFSMQRLKKPQRIA